MSPERHHERVLDRAQQARDRTSIKLAARSFLPRISSLRTSAIATCVSFFRCDPQCAQLSDWGESSESPMDSPMQLNNQGEMNRTRRISCGSLVVFGFPVRSSLAFMHESVPLDTWRAAAAS